MGAEMLKVKGAAADGTVVRVESPKETKEAASRLIISAVKKVVGVEEGLPNASLPETVQVPLPVAGMDAGQSTRECATLIAAASTNK
jgi:hypothetical protein